MIVRIGCASSYDMDFNDYEFEQRLRTMGVIFSHRGTEAQRSGGYDFFRRDADVQREWKSLSVVFRSGIKVFTKGHIR